MSSPGADRSHRDHGLCAQSIGTEVSAQPAVSRCAIFQACILGHRRSLEPPPTHPLFPERRFAMTFSDCGMDRAIALRASIAKSAMK